MTTYTEEKQESICQVKGNHQKDVKGGDSTVIDSIRKCARVDLIPWAEPARLQPGQEHPRDLQMQTHVGSSCPVKTGLTLWRKMRHKADVL